MRDDTGATSDRGLEAVCRAYTAHPLRGCPGRYVLRGARPDATPGSLVGPDATTTLHHSAAARDRVAVTWLGDWGLISYLRVDGSWLHTANTAGGFRRKLERLGIRPPVPCESPPVPPIIPS